MAVRLSLARVGRGALFHQGDDHQIEVRRVARQAIGESAAVPPAAFSWRPITILPRLCSRA
jgi:hypothetical protein